MGDAGETGAEAGRSESVMLLGFALVDNAENHDLDLDT